MSDSDQEKVRLEITGNDNDPFDSEAPEGNLAQEAADAIDQLMAGQFAIGRVPNAADCVQVLAEATQTTKRRNEDKDALDSTQASLAASHLTTLLGYHINWVIEEVRRRGPEAITKPLARVSLEVKDGKVLLPICDAERLKEIVEQIKEAMPGYRVSTKTNQVAPEAKQVQISADLEI